MIIAVLFGALVSILSHQTINQEDCKKFNFKPKACKISHEMSKLK
jgi:hypothetical protein